MKIKNKLYYLILSVAIISCGKDKPIVTPEVTPITITEFYPQKMITGRELTIVGTNFDPVAANNVVKINGVAATVNYASTTAINVTIPAVATSGKITVNTGTVSATSSNDFTVINNPYQNVRIKSITTKETSIRRVFSYDALNRVNNIGNYHIDAQGVLTLESVNAYTYLPDGKLDKETYKIISPASKILTVAQYNYVDNVLAKITKSTIDETNASSPIVTINSIEKYDFAKGLINSVTGTDSQGKTLYTNKYVYSLIGDNPQTVITKISATQNTITILYNGDLLSPLSLTLPTPYLSLFFEKSYAFSNISGEYGFGIQTDQSTNRITTGYALLNKIVTATENYQYEDK